MVDRSRMRENAFSLLDDNNGERWIEPEEITDSAAPDLRAARDVILLADEIEVTLLKALADETQCDKMTESAMAGWAVAWLFRRALMQIEAAERMDVPVRVRMEAMASFARTALLATEQEMTI